MSRDPADGAEKPPRFGDVAVRMGFLSERQLSLALELQRGLESGRDKQRRLIGLLLVELGCLTQTQLLLVLEELEELDRRLGRANPVRVESGPVRVIVEVDPGASDTDDTERVRVLDPH